MWEDMDQFGGKDGNVYQHEKEQVQEGMMSQHQVYPHWGAENETTSRDYEYTMQKRQPLNYHKDHNYQETTGWEREYQ